MMIAYGLPMELAVATSLLVNIVVGATSARGYLRKRGADLGGVARLLPGAVVGAAGGVFLFLAWGSGVVKVLFALFLGALGGVMLVRGSARPGGGDDGTPRTGARAAWECAIGAVAGMTAGLFGIGGGVVAVPAQRYLLGCPIRRAIANATFLIVCICAVAASVLIPVFSSRGLFAPSRPFVIAPWLVLGAFPGAYLGVRLNGVIPVGVLGRVFGAYLVVVAIKMGTDPN